MFWILLVVCFLVGWWFGKNCKVDDNYFYGRESYRLVGELIIYLDGLVDSGMLSCLELKNLLEDLHIRWYEKGDLRGRIIELSGIVDGMYRLLDIKVYNTIKKRLDLVVDYLGRR